MENIPNVHRSLGHKIVTLKILQLNSQIERITNENSRSFVEKKMEILLVMLDKQANISRLEVGLRVFPAGVRIYTTPVK